MGEEARQLRLLVLSYACSPFLGSEAGAGWGMVRVASEIAQVTAVVSPHHANDRARWLEDHPDDSIRFVEVPLKKGGLLTSLVRRIDHRGFMTYVQWLKEAEQVSIALNLETPFDASLHASIGSYWLPSPLVHLNVPCVWGPVGGATRTPWRLWRYLGLRGWFGEIEKAIAVRLATLLPSVKETWRESAIRLAETPETRDALPKSSSGTSTRLLNRVLFHDVQTVPPNDVGYAREPFLIFPSALEGRKGPRLAIHALAAASESVRLIFTNDGRELVALHRLAQRLGVEHRVEFKGKIPRDEMLAMMSRATAVVLTGLRETGGMALAEAMILGTPVIALAHGGPNLVAGFATDPSRLVLIEPESPGETTRRLGEAMTHFVESPNLSSGAFIDRVRAKQALHQAIQDAASRSA
jgi:glycosyltransferase involved in cell wall biosynthesis